MLNEEVPLTCALCGAMWKASGATNCWSSSDKRPPQPENCPSKIYNEVIDEAFSRYMEKDTEEARIAQVATRVEGLCYHRGEGGEALYARWNRVEDTVAFAKLMAYRKIGIASCVGLLMETKQLAAIFEAQGFDVVTVCCKAGSIDKMRLGIEEKDKVRPGQFEPACNPVAQAEIFNRRSTDMNIIVGLCVGHDMLFNKHSQAPVTTLVVKDRVTGHNPVAVLYGQNYYYRRLQSQPVIGD
ncbi:MAG TPA: DUF1847 domain-containing protein [Geobacteraceae bacterium]